MNDTTPQHRRTPLCEYTLNEIAAELVWRATQPAVGRPWRPGFLLQHEARVLADIAVADALRAQEDAGDPVRATDDGCAFLTGAAQVVLDRIEPGRWRTAVGACGGRAEVSVIEREAR